MRVGVRMIAGGVWGVCVRECVSGPAGGGLCADVGVLDMGSPRLDPGEFEGG